MAEEAPSWSLSGFRMSPSCANSLLRFPFLGLSLPSDDSPNPCIHFPPCGASMSVRRASSIQETVNPDPRPWGVSSLPTPRCGPVCGGVGGRGEGDSGGKLSALGGDGGRGSPLHPPRQTPSRGRQRAGSERQGARDLGSLRRRRPGDFQPHCCQENVSPVPLAQQHSLGSGPGRPTPPHAAVRRGSHLPGQPSGWAVPGRQECPGVTKPRRGQRKAEEGSPVGSSVGGVTASPAWTCPGSTGLPAGSVTSFLKMTPMLCTLSWHTLTRVLVPTSAHSDMLTLTYILSHSDARAHGHVQVHTHTHSMTTVALSREHTHAQEHNTHGPSRTHSSFFFFF